MCPFKVDVRVWDALERPIDEFYDEIKRGESGTSIGTANAVHVHTVSEAGICLNSSSEAGICLNSSSEAGKTLDLDGVYTWNDMTVSAYVRLCVCVCVCVYL